MSLISVYQRSSAVRFFVPGAEGERRWASSLSFHGGAVAGLLLKRNDSSEEGH